MQASVRRFWLLHKTINRGNGTECLLRCCSAARILHSERPAFACDCRSYGWVAQLAEQWTENPRVGGSIPPPAIFKGHRSDGRGHRSAYSVRRAVIGFTLVARRAGRKQASKAAAASRALAVTSAKGSLGLT